MANAVPAAVNRTSASLVLRSWVCFCWTRKFLGDLDRSRSPEAFTCVLGVGLGCGVSVRVGRGEHVAMGMTASDHLVIVALEAVAPLVGNDADGAAVLVGGHCFQPYLGSCANRTAYLSRTITATPAINTSHKAG